MGSAYTPGLTVSEDTIISKTRRLPLKGTVLVERGQEVAPDTVVARADLPGIMHSVKAASILGCDPEDVPHSLLVQVGDPVTRGQVIARTTGLWGLFKSEAKATTTGTVEIVSPVTGNVGIRETPTPIEVSAYIGGTVTEILSGEGVVISTRGAFVQGIFGVGGERRARLRTVSGAPDAVLTGNEITPDLAGWTIVGGARVTGEALKKAAESGVVGIIVGGITDTDLIEFLGYDIGVAITGHEDIPLTLVLTEGFGKIAMARRTYDLLRSRDGQYASFSGATQIRAGVIRPEVIIEGRPAGASDAPADAAASDSSLAIGTAIRIIREPYFGRLATVTGLPPELVRVESGAEVRVLQARLSGGESVTVPRANVERIL
ncbi:MAG: hypothetical protein SFU56_06350 [Capsulimonadales bacterium]|nr:hypothetical protein [Capsulimonadales bacterium]